MTGRRPQALEQMHRILGDSIGVGLEELPPPPGCDCDLLAKADNHLFLVDIRRSGSAAPVYAAARKLREVAQRYNPSRRADPSTIVVPLLVVPYMGPVGRRICQEEGLSWIDLSGNADIGAERLRIRVTGNKNRFKRRGRRATPFSPKASRVVRQLLMDYPRRRTQAEIVQLTGVDQGFVSRILRGLEQEQLVTRIAKAHEPTGRAQRKEGVYQIVNSSLLLRSWQEEYDFTRHRIIRGHIAARSSAELLHSLATAFQQAGYLVAATGLAGAWLLTHFAAFRLVTLYLNAEPRGQLLDDVGFRHDDRGANTWLVVPNDEGVFAGRQEREGIECSHPVQVYLDLQSHPERSAEASARLHELYLHSEGDA